MALDLSLKTRIRAVDTILHRTLKSNTKQVRFHENNSLSGARIGPITWSRLLQQRKRHIQETAASEAAGDVTRGGCIATQSLVTGNERLTSNEENVLPQCAQSYADWWLNSYVPESCAAAEAQSANQMAERLALDGVIISGAAMATTESEVHDHASEAQSQDKTPFLVTVPRDPRKWTRQDVHSWLCYMKTVHNLEGLRDDRFLMNGKALCLMTADMFSYRVPVGGKLLYRDFRLRLSRALVVPSCA